MASIEIKLGAAARIVTRFSQVSKIVTSDGIYGASTALATSSVCGIIDRYRLCLEICFKSIDL